jgi:hypothetical protein
LFHSACRKMGEGKLFMICTLDVSYLLLSGAEMFVLPWHWSCIALQ